jgi:hypothetical protein
LFSSVQIYLVFIFDKIDLTNIYSVWISYIFVMSSVYLKRDTECQITNMFSKFYSKYLMWWPIYLRTLGKILFLQKNIFEGPPKGGQSPKSEISKFSESYDVGTLNLCLKMTGTMPKESAQSDHPVLRKRQKRA